MKSQPLLSVVVPCYNAEQYMDKCISSIVGQTYSNLEILLINDGSTDNTGMICNSWQERDNRIKAIHKQNEGSSYARKDGVKLALGEYVTFVDSDDWIDKNMYVDMMSALLSTNSDIAQCSYCHVFEDGFVEHRVSEEKKGTVETVGQREGVIMILERKWHTGMWDKIYKKSLFQHIIFPKGRGFAEDFINQFLFHHASQSIFVHNDYYFYFQRAGSLCNPIDTQMKLKKYRDHVDAYFERYGFVKQHPEYQAALPCVKRDAIKAGIILLRNIIVFPQHFTKEYFREKMEQVFSISIARNDHLPSGLKIELYLIKNCFKLYKFLLKLYVQVVFLTNRLKITDKRIFCS